MTRRSPLQIAFAGLLLLAALTSCSDGDPSGAHPLMWRGVRLAGYFRVAPDFSLVDTNRGSPRFGRSVSPRDEIRNVSAWYFGHAN